MTHEFKVGQRVRVDGSGRAIEGMIISEPPPVRTLWVDVESHVFPMGRMQKVGTITILSQPRPEEPKGLGAVVEAHVAKNPDRRQFIRIVGDVNLWQAPSGWLFDWDELIDPVVLSEGYLPEGDA